MGYINPLLKLPAAQRLMKLPPGQRAAMAALLREIRAEASIQAEISWERRKAPMAAYWRVVSTYARHIAHVLDQVAARDTAVCDVDQVNDVGERDGLA